MDLRILNILIIMSFVVACGSSSDKSPEVPFDSIDALELVSAPTSTRLEVEWLQSRGDFSRTSKSVPNRHLPGKMDSLIYFQNNRNSFTFYKADSSIWLVEAIVEDDIIPWKSGIKTGISREELFARIDGFEDNGSQTSVLTDEMGMDEMHFVFEKDSLQRIELHKYLD